VTAHRRAAGDSPGLRARVAGAPLLAALLIALGAGAARSARPAEAGPIARSLPFEREIRLADSASGRVEVPFDTGIYAKLSSDLGNLRIADDLGNEVPWLRETPPPPSWVDAAVRGRILDRAFVAGSHASLVLDLGRGHAPVNRLVVPSAGEEFTRRVTVEGRDAGTPWQTIRDDGLVYRLRAEREVRNETVSIPDASFEEIRVTVHEDPRGEREPVRIGDVTAFHRETTSRERQTFEGRIVNAGERREWTLLAVDLGVPHLPIEQLHFEARESNYVRNVDVHEEAEKATAPVRLGDGTIHAVGIPGAGRPARDDGVPIARPATARLMVRIWNGDSPPLHVTRVIGSGPVEKLVFLAEKGRSYRLYLGGTRVRAPRYDLSEVLARAGPGPRIPGTLGPVVENPDYRPPVLGDRARSALLWVSMFAAVLGLAFVLVRLFRKAAAGAAGPDA
jgi:hypothetical protein